MVTLELLGIGVVISYGVAALMVVILKCIKAFGNDKKEAQHS